MQPEPQGGEDDGTQVLDGPDPRTWPGLPELWGLAEDIRVLDDIHGLLSGSVARDASSPAYDEARRFLRTAAAQRCEELSELLLGLYGLTAGEEGAGAAPFQAGKPRASGAGSPPEGTIR